MRIKLLAVLALVGGPIVAFVSYSKKQTFDKIVTEGVEVDGTLEKGESTKRKGVTSYKFDVAWKTKEGKSFTKNMSLSSSFVKPRLNGDSITDWDVKVKYLPSDPNEAFVVGAESDPKSGIYGGGVVGLLGLAGTAWMFRKRNG